MRWEECTAREAAREYHAWRGWDEPVKDGQVDNEGEPYAAPGEL